MGFIEIFAQLYKKYKICLKVVLIQNSNKKLTTELLSTTLLTPGGKWHNTINCCDHHPHKVIIEKSRGGRFLWNRNLGWIWASWH